MEGGTANNYVYVSDPVNDFDLTGAFGWKSFASIASIGSIIPGPIGMASAAVSAAAYAAAGDKKNACLMAAGIAAAAAGAGGAVVAYKSAKLASSIAAVAKVREGKYALESAGRLTSAAAGRMYDGRGASTTAKGYLRSADGLRQYRPPTYKVNYGVRQSNFDRRPNTSVSWKNKNQVNRGHVTIRKWRW